MKKHNLIPVEVDLERKRVWIPFNDQQKIEYHIIKMVLDSNYTLSIWNNKHKSEIVIYKTRIQFGHKIKTIYLATDNNQWKMLE